MSTIHPTDWAVLLLALGGDPPRLRARDQQADRAGSDLRRTMLHRLIELDPEPEALTTALAAIIAEIGEPTGPSRAIATSLLQEWADGQVAPGYWPWLISEAIEAGAVEPGRRRKRRKDQADG